MENCENKIKRERRCYQTAISFKKKCGIVQLEDSSKSAYLHACTALKKILENPWDSP
jgi:hypothetical protein